MLESGFTPWLCIPGLKVRLDAGLKRGSNGAETRAHDTGALAGAQTGLKQSSHGSLDWALDAGAQT